LEDELKMISLTRTLPAAIGVVAWLVGSALAGIKPDDINIGVDASSHRLVLLWSGEEVELEELNGPLFGFGLDEPGLISIESAVMGLVPPDPGANLVLEVIAFDPALRGWTPGFGASFRFPGDTFDLGGVPAHEHVFWHIDATDLGYVAPPAQTEWNATFRILDTGSTGYLPSEPITVTFLPEPGSVVLLAALAALSGRTARRRGLRFDRT
jgi:hypothetical protein